MSYRSWSYTLELGHCEDLSGACKIMAKGLQDDPQLMWFYAGAAYAYQALMHRDVPDKDNIVSILLSYAEQVPIEISPEKGANNDE